MEFTDIHCHIIPQVDDGSDSIETSLRLVQMMYDDGIRKVVTTPHFGIINPSYDPVRVTERFELLSAKVGEIYPDMKLYRGNEIFFAPGYSDGLDDGMSCTLAGSSYVLAEFDDGVDYDTVVHIFRRLLLRGYSPVWAHAERYMHVYRNTKGLRSIVAQGVMVQVNSGSVCTLAEPERRRLFGGNSEKKVLKEMFKEGLVHFVGTDCHDMPDRKPSMTEAARVLTDLIGEDKTREIMIENPGFVLAGV